MNHGRRTGRSLPIWAGFPGLSVAIGLGFIPPASGQGVFGERRFIMNSISGGVPA